LSWAYWCAGDDGHSLFWALNQRQPHREIDTFRATLARSPDPKKKAPGNRELFSNSLCTYFLGNHFFQFSANSSTLSFVTGIRSPFTKEEGGFLLSATLSYNMSTDLVPHS
jgi:hypothetical protein